MRLKRLLACAWLAATGTACNHYEDHTFATAPTPAGLIGSGRVVTAARPVGEFTTIALTGAIEAVVTLGGSGSLDITADDNIAPLVDAVTVNGRLTIGFRAGTTSIRPSAAVTCRIGARSLRGVDLSGAARIQVDGIDARELSLDLSGASSFRGTGAVDRLRMNLSGASRVTAPSLRGGEVDATLSGASAALVRVVDALTARASGASLLEYFGDPALQVDASSGSVVRRLGP